jgi:hypothetical protein
VDLAALRDELKRDVYASTIDQLRDRASKVDELNLQLSKIQAAKALQADIIKEVLAQYPSITRMSVADGAAVARAGAAPAGSGVKPVAANGATAIAAAGPAPVTLVLVQAQPRLGEADVERIKAGLRVRLPDTTVELVQLPDPAPPKPARRRS